MMTQQPARTLPSKILSFFRNNDPVLLAITGTILVVGLLVAFREYTQDDVFITYAYSRNIALGNGFVFNLGERVQGTTTPLYTLLMAAVYRLTPDLLHIGNILSALFLLAACALALRLLRGQVSRAGRWAFMLLAITSPLIYVSFGMETLFYIVLFMVSVCLWTGQRRALAMLAAASLTWTRADGVVLGVALCLIALWESRAIRPVWRAIPWRLGVTYMLGIAPWFLFAWAYFGSLLPNTFSAKQEFLKGLKFWSDGLFWWNSFYGNNPLSLLAIPLTLVGIERGLRSPRLRPLALWSVLYAVGYTALNVTTFWYYTPFVFVLIILTVIGAESVVRGLLRQQAFVHRRRLVLAVCAGLLVISSLLGLIRALEFHAPPERVETYRLTGLWIADHTPVQSSVVVADLGIVGYYAQRRMIDSFGLITPAMVASRDIENAREIQDAVRRFQPDYVVATQYFFFKKFVSADWFTRDYRPVVQFSTPHDPFSPMTVYQRRDKPSDPVPSQTAPLSAVWEPFAQLSRITLPDGALTWSGGSLPVQLDWKAIGTAPQDYSLFIHVLNADGILVAQADGAPNGQPVTSWHPQDTIQDVRTLALPANLPAGDYRLEVGWYDWRTGTRVPLQTSDKPASDALILPITFRNQWPGGSGLP